MLQHTLPSFTRRRQTKLVAGWIGGCLLLALALALLGQIKPLAPVYAQSGSGTLRVALSGSDGPACGSVASPCRTVQYAVDLATDGDEILVASGTYTGVLLRAGRRQVVYVTKTLTIRGGYTTSNSFAGPPLPATQPTILDARQSGRVLYVSGSISPVFEGIQLVGGNALAGEAATPNGGGASVTTAAAIFRECRVYNNVATSVGGGVHLQDSPALLVGNAIYSNSAGYGGGIGLSGSGVVLSGNLVYSNTTTGYGGGINIYQGNKSWLTGNVIASNKAQLNGGGLYLGESASITVTGNSIHGNTAQQDAGGAEIYSTTVFFSINDVYDNKAIDVSGGGLNVYSGSGVISDCNIYSNSANINGGGVFLNHSDLLLAGNRVYSNRANNGAGVKLELSPARIEGNLILQNGPANFGGAMDVYASPAQIVGNRILSNTSGYGGGVIIYSCPDALFSGNVVGYNQASSDGGGLRIHVSTNTSVVSNTFYENIVGGDGAGTLVDASLTTFERNSFLGNQAGGKGGGLRLVNASRVNMSNSLIADNDASQAGGAFIGGSAISMTFTTLAGGSHGGIVLQEESGQPATAWLTNTIVVSQATGVQALANCTASLQATLWGDGAWANTVNVAGPGSVVTGTLNYVGNPDFVDANNGNYHILPNSAARNRGIDVGVDVDRDDRTRVPPPDLGAYEAFFATYMPLLFGK